MINSSKRTNKSEANALLEEVDKEFVIEVTAQCKNVHFIRIFSRF